MCHVLIIEDEPLVAMTIQDILTLQGATSFEIVDTEEAAVSAAAANEPSVITSDVKLLEGTGPAAVAEIHKRLGPIPVIFITGSPEECEPCDPPGSIVRKPFTEQVVAAAFHKAARLS
jgi:CheY-like chemotaxis protein